MPTFSHFAIRRRMRLSAIRCSRNRIVHEWAMASKKPWIYESRAFDEKVESMMVDSQDGANRIQYPHWDKEASHEWGSLIPTICANVSLRQSKPVIPARKLLSCTTWL